MSSLETFQPHQIRVINEKADLDQKISALYAFIATGRVMYIDDYEWSRLLTQYQIMRIYSQILGERIANFKV